MCNTERFAPVCKIIVVLLAVISTSAVSVRAQIVFQHAYGFSSGE